MYRLSAGLCPFPSVPLGRLSPPRPPCVSHVTASLSGARRGDCLSAGLCQFPAVTIDAGRSRRRHGSFYRTVSVARLGSGPAGLVGTARHRGVRDFFIPPPSSVPRARFSGYRFLGRSAPTSLRTLHSAPSALSPPPLPSPPPPPPSPSLPPTPPPPPQTSQPSIGVRGVS